MQFFLGADHNGFELKQQILTWLQNQNISCTDCGNFQLEPEDDYPDFAKAVAKNVLDNPDSYGILICGSAQGMAMQANRFKGIRAAICTNSDEAIESREHNDANVLCLAASQKPNFVEIISAFANATMLPDEKYSRRKNKLDEG